MKVKKGKKKVDVKVLREGGFLRKGILTRVPWRLVVGVLAIAGLMIVAYTKGWLFAAQVNGKFVNRWELTQRLEEAYGNQVLENLIVEKLVEQEAGKQKVGVSKEELEAKIEEITKQVPDGDLEQALAWQGLSRKQFERQLRVNILVEKLVGENVTVTDEEIDDYIEQNEDSLDMSNEGMRNEVREQLRQNKLYQQASDLIKSLQESAKIKKFS